MATGTGTRRNLAAMREAGWGLLLTPDRPELRPGWPPLPYAVDNGAWGCHQQGIEWTPGRWLSLVREHGRTALWCVLPDVVMGGEASLRRSLFWLGRVYPMAARWLIAVQDGMTAERLAAHVGPKVGVFVGGSTEWKEATLPMWGALCRNKGAWFHVGRMNSRRKLLLCTAAGADSVDGTSVTRYAVTLPKLDLAARQMGLGLYGHTVEVEDA